MRLAAKNAGAGRFGGRLRALERLPGGEGGRGPTAFGGERPRAGGVVGGAGVWRGGEGEKCYEMMTSQPAHLLDRGM